ncbi:MAG: hypothetical protein MUO72_05655 [Bacteroidales bacterium]|nr:hypothetical protein [Bacteroidales bacterium]
MNTTSLLVDILIIGIQVSIWIAGFIFSFIFPFSQVMRAMEKFPASAIIVVIAIFYTLGLIFDYIIANIFTHFKSEEEKATYRDGLVISILSFDKQIQIFLDNQYARLRISRATLINLPIIIISSCCFVLTNPISLRFSLCYSIIAILIIGIIMTILSYIGWKERNKTYWNYIKATLQKMEIDQKKTGPTTLVEN